MLWNDMVTWADLRGGGGGGGLTPSSFFEKAMLFTRIFFVKTTFTNLSHANLPLCCKITFRLGEVYSLMSILH